jgi:hypothetical protein
VGRLSNQDHRLLHELGGTHGEVVAWLEQQITEHGDLTWAGAGRSHAGQDWHAQARQWVQAVDAEEEQSLGDLQRVVHRCGARGWATKWQRSSPVERHRPRTARTRARIAAPHRLSHPGRKGRVGPPFAALTSAL